MAEKQLKRPRDPIELAKLIGDIATGEVVDKTDDDKNPAAVELGRLGGLKGGKARAESLSKKRRVGIAKKAAAARWKNR
ncbi:MAG: histone H1 [Casimicrobiaceae bacterium]